MKLRDILPRNNDIPLKIIVRTYDPFGEDMLFGFCRWENGELISEDGDSYDLDDEVIRFEMTYNPNKFCEYLLTYWFESEWTTGEEDNE